MADWVEFMALARTSAFKRGELKTAIGQENVESPETLEQEAWYALEQRAALFQETWPLRLVGNRLRRRTPSPINLGLYRFLCLLGFASLEATDRKLFELVVTKLVEPLTGTPAINVGHPAAAGMDASFRNRIEAYSQAAKLLPSEVKAGLLPDDKDLGLDIVTWLPFKDQRGAFLHVLVQCATGPDWEGKLHDIDITVWRGHINWGVEPVRIFAVPGVIFLPEAKWVRASQKGGLILDRPRLIELSTRLELPPDLVRAMAARTRLLAAA
ncbi:MAG: hypothetical protein ACJ77A_02555 [Actinomycetota bacterium]